MVGARVADYHAGARRRTSRTASLRPALSSIGFQSSRNDVSSDERVDVRRYLAAISRSRRLIAGIVIFVTAVVLVVSLATSKTYTATTSIVLQQDTTGLGDTSADTLTRILNTTQKLITAEPVLDAAARKLPGEDADSLEDKLSSEVDPTANIIDVKASDGDPRHAAAIANTVSRTFLAERAELERQNLARSRQRLQAQLDRIESTPTADVQAAALRERISQLSVAENSAGSDLQIVAPADPPESPSSPRPFRNAIIAIFGSLFLAILIALGRDQLSPRVSSPRELGRLLDLRVLVGVPYVRQGSRNASLMSEVEAEAYETLRASVEVGAPPGARTLLVTGAVHAEGKTTVTWRLGNALARTGHRTLIVSADLRVPRMQAVAKVPLGVGLADILAAAESESSIREIVEESIVEIVPANAARRQNGCLHLITSGGEARDPGRLLAGPGMGELLTHLRELDYDFVLLDAPPLIGIADSQVLARSVDQMMLVTRLDRLTLDHVAELREIVDRLDVPVLGLVVIGARGEASPYYLGRRPPLIRSEAEAPN
jgi:Mrp family chromosome partitioning ATPase/capsular polysaccharide biosynthesis protein